MKTFKDIKKAALTKSYRRRLYIFSLVLYWSGVLLTPFALIGIIFDNIHTTEFIQMFLLFTCIGLLGMSLTENYKK